MINSPRSGAAALGTKIIFFFTSSAAALMQEITGSLWRGQNSLRQAAQPRINISRWIQLNNRLHVFTIIQHISNFINSSPEHEYRLTCGIIWNSWRLTTTQILSYSWSHYWNIITDVLTCKQHFNASAGGGGAHLNSFFYINGWFNQQESIISYKMIMFRLSKC